MAAIQHNTDLLNAIATARNACAAFDGSDEAGEDVQKQLEAAWRQAERRAFDARPRSPVEAVQKLRWLINDVESVSMSSEIHDVITDLERLIQA